MVAKRFFVLMVCIATVLAHEHPNNLHETSSKDVIERKNDHVACNPFTTPRFSCFSCYTIIECKESGGKIRQCKDPYAPYCNGGMCSPEPGELCEKPDVSEEGGDEEGGVNGEGVDVNGEGVDLNGEGGDGNGEGVDLNEEGVDENGEGVDGNEAGGDEEGGDVNEEGDENEVSANEEGGDENNDDTSDNEVEEQELENNNDESNDENIGDEAETVNEEADAGDENGETAEGDDSADDDDDENKIPIAPEFRNAVADETHPPNHHHHHHHEENDDERTKVAKIDEENINLRQSRFLPCNYTIIPEFSCYDCRVRIICKYPVGGKLAYCHDSMPYCNNGVCSTEPSEECA